jgi:hypothetical protein
MQTGFFGSLGSTFVDLLDTAGNAAIRDRFGESNNESSEGFTEFANPHTVSQPVRPSNNPAGQPLNDVASRLGVSSTVLIVGGVVVAMLGGALFFKLIGGK